MAHGQNAQKRGKRGKEYWQSRLGCQGEAPGPTTKLLTHRRERQVAKAALRQGQQPDVMKIRQLPIRTTSTTWRADDCATGLA